MKKTVRSLSFYALATSLALAQSSDPNTADPYTYSRNGDFKSAKLRSTSTHGYGIYICEMQMSPSPTVSTFWLYADAPAIAFAEDIYQLWRWSEIDFEFVPYTQTGQVQYLTFDWADNKVSDVTLYAALLEGSSIYQGLGLDTSAFSAWQAGVERTDSQIAQQVLDAVARQQTDNPAPTGGTFDLVFVIDSSPVTVSGIAYDATASDLQTAINNAVSTNSALSAAINGSVTVATLNPGQWNVNFGTALDKASVPNIYLNTSTLTPANACLGTITPGISGDTVTNMIVAVFQTPFVPAEGQSMLELLAANTGSATPATPTQNTITSATEWKYPVTQIATPTNYPLNRMGSLNFWRAPLGISQKSLDFSDVGYGTYNFQAIYDGPTAGTTDASYFTSEALSNETFFWDTNTTTGYDPYSAIYTYVIVWTPERIAHYLLPRLNRTQDGLPDIDIDSLTPLMEFTPDKYESMSQFGINGTAPSSGEGANGGTVPFIYTEQNEEIGKVSLNLGNYVAFTEASLTSNENATPASPGWSGAPPGRNMPDSNAYVRSVGFFGLKETSSTGTKTSDFDLTAPGTGNDNFWVDFSDTTTWTTDNWQKKITKFFQPLYTNNFTHYTGESGSLCLYPNISPSNLSLVTLGSGQTATQVLALTAGVNELPTPKEDLSAWETPVVNPFYQVAVTAPPYNSSITATNPLMRVVTYEEGNPDNYWTANSALLNPTFIYAPASGETVSLTVNLEVYDAPTADKTSPTPAASYTATITLSLDNNGYPTFTIPTGGDPSGIISDTSSGTQIQLVNPALGTESEDAAGFSSRQFGFSWVYPQGVGGKQPHPTGKGSYYGANPSPILISPQYGYIYAGAFPWVYSFDFEDWVYPDLTEAREQLWLWNDKLGWSWSNDYPWVYSNDQSTWFYVDSGYAYDSLSGLWLRLGSS